MYTYILPKVDRCRRQNCWLLSRRWTSNCIL